jgi:hypothetical protein
MARTSRRSIWRAAVVATAALSMGGVQAEDVLETIGFNSCSNVASSVKVERVDIKYDKENQTVTFDVSGSSSRVQNVTAELKVTAYGTEVFSNKFNPCAPGTFVDQLCPVPAGTFGARGTQKIPDEFASLVPTIAFQIPDIAAMATLELKSLDSNQSVACIQSKVTNGKTASVPAVSYVAAGVAGAAMLVTGASALGAAFAGGGAVGGGGSSAGGTGTISPSFTEVFTWFQGMAMNGMMSVNLPPVYRSFSKNFAFSMGLIPWTTLQASIDSFRNSTGGNLTASSVGQLQQTTLVFPDGTEMSGNSSLFRVKRALDGFARLAERQIETSINTTAPDATTAGQAGDPAGNEMASLKQAVSGIQGYVQALSIPESNTFMTVLLIVAIVIAAIAVGILLVKVILEFWALFGSFPKALAGFRKHYWGSIARSITHLILLLYGVWVLYCVFQFTHGDSWAAKALAAVTLVLFTSILAFFSYKIWSTARRLKKNEGDASALYDDKSIWVKYSLFYDTYKKSYWWIFVPVIAYMFVKGALLAAADGHGMVQTAGQLIVESIMLILLLWSRPFERKSGNVINIMIQVVRVLSVVCILVFVEEFGIAQTTQTVTGVALIAVQGALTGILALLIIWNAFNALCQKNRHRERRKEMGKSCSKVQHLVCVGAQDRLTLVVEKLNRDVDNLTPLSPHNSLLMPKGEGEGRTATFSVASTLEKQPAASYPARSVSPERYLGYETTRPAYGAPQLTGNGFRPLTPVTPPFGADQSRENLVLSAAPIGRQPALPDVGMGGGYGNAGYGGYNQGYGGGYGYGRSPPGAY